MHDARKPVKDIAQGYPRGQRELLGPYTSGTYLIHPPTHPPTHRPIPEV